MSIFATWLKYCRYGVKLYPTNQSIFATTTKRGGGVPAFMILYTMNQVYSACVIQWTIQIFYHYHKFGNDNILVIKHTFYICFIFLLPLRMIYTILCWIYSASTLSVGKTGDSYKESEYMFNSSMRILHCIFSVSFRFSFRSVFRSVFRSAF